MSKVATVPYEITLHVRDHCLCLHTQRAARALARRFDMALRPVGLTNGQFSLIMSLNRPKPPSIGSLADLLAMDRTTLTANLKPLERRGLVRTSVDPADRRGRLLTLTDEGRALLAQATPIWIAEHARVEDMLTATGAERLREGLRAVSRGEPAAGPPPVGARFRSASAIGLARSRRGFVLSHTGLTGLAGVAAAIEAKAAPARRILVALAGPPGVGKSTFSERLRDRLNGPGGACEILPMDGFHYDDMVLNARGHRPRKGAPHTFDVEGLTVMLGRVKAATGEIAVPVFDRDLEIARAGARIIGADARIILVEGNYLLLDDPRWAPMRPLFDLTILLEAPFVEIETRLRRRWAGLSAAELVDKLDGNDLPNARLVLERSVEPDIRVPNAG